MVDGGLEDAPVESAQIQHWGTPLKSVVLGPLKCPPGAHDAVVHGAAFGHMLVEELGEQNRRPVGDLKLHSHHRRNFPANERSRNTGKRVRGTASPGVAGIEHHQTQRTVIGK
jgi:hypothetical protein